MFESDTGFLLSVLRNFWEHFFYRTFLGDCFWWRSLVIKNFNSVVFPEENLSRDNWRNWYVTCKFLSPLEIHPGLNSTLPMVKVLFVVTCSSELKIQPYGYFISVLTTGLKFELCYNSACFYHRLPQIGHLWTSALEPRHWNWNWKWNWNWNWYYKRHYFQFHKAYGP